MEVDRKECSGGVRLALVIPCYNEEDVLDSTMERLMDIFSEMRDSGMISTDSFILLCDDGSTDGTWNVIRRFHEHDPRVRGLRLAGNAGQQNALIAGLEAVADNCDAVVTLDADLQDDPGVLPEMLRHYCNGKDIVYGVRSSRSADSLMKRLSAAIFYKLQTALGLRTVPQHADYRLMSGMAAGMLLAYGERNLFLRGIVAQLGLDYEVVKYERGERKHGESKYPLSRMLGLAIDGITSFSARPMRMIFLTGMVLLLISIFVTVYVLVSYFCGGTVSGWTSLMLSVWFLGSLVLMSIGTVGEYVGKIYMEVKHRPRYAVRDRLPE